MATIVADDALAEAAGAPIDVDMLEIKLTAYSPIIVLECLPLLKFYSNKIDNKIAYKIATKVLYYGLNFSNYTHTSCSPQESR
jgi:hypothetical protein